MKHFARFFAIVLFVSMVFTLLPGGMINVHAAGDYTGYTSLDDGINKIEFDGETVTWNGQTWTLGTNTIFLDYRLEDAYVAENPYAFNEIHEAINYLNAHQGSNTSRMNFLIAPGVYWLDDPDDPAIREGNSPYGGSVTGGWVKISCNYLTFQGLNTNASNVVICANRGQQLGSQGNFTNINMKSTDLITRDLTFGNYCNVDLVFPLDSKLPEGQKLSRAKRSEVITQAQLFNMGVTATMYNTNFISRLNLCPLTGTYYNCRLESSGHSGAGSNFINCDLYFYNMNFAGGKYFNCDITICPFDSTWYGKQVHAFNWQDTFTVGGMALVDCRIHSAENLKQNGVKVELTWGKPVDGKYPYSYVSDGYTYNVTLDGEPYLVQETYTPGVTVDMAKYPTLLAAYRVVDPVDGTVYYNLSNNGVSPVPEQMTGNAAAIQAIAEAEGKASNYYTNIPTAATISLSSSSIVSGETTATVTPKVSGSKTNGVGTWNVFFRDAEETAKYAELQDNGDGTWTIVGKNDSEEPYVAIVVAQNELGIMKAAEITILPSKTEAPVIIGDVTIGDPVDGRIPLNYTIDLGSDKRTEQSVINWYLCDDAEGHNPVLVAISRDDIPEYEYVIGEGDAGKYVMATIQAKHNRSDLAEEKITAISTYAIKAEDIKVHYIDNDMRNMPDGAQTEYKPGAWVRDGYKPVDCKKQATWTPSSNSWSYGPGKEGAMGYNGFIYTKQGGRLYYNPVSQHAGNMFGEVTLATCKNAGQGFGSANDQYTELYIKYNQQLAMNPTADDIGKVVGYGVRCERLTAADVAAIPVDEGEQPWSDAGAGAGVCFCLVRLVIQDVDGTLKVVPEKIGKKVMTSAYNSLCTMSLEYKDGTLTGHIESTMEERSADVQGYLREATLTLENIPDNGFSGFGYQSTGTTNPSMSTNCNYTLVNSVYCLWGDPAIEADADAEFGDIALNEEAKKAIKISAKDLADVLDIEVEGEGIEVELGDDFDNTNGGEITILIDTTKAGEIKGTVTIKTAGAELEIPVSANVKDASVPTGDNAPLEIMVALMAASAIMIALVSKKRKNA